MLLAAVLGTLLVAQNTGACPGADLTTSVSVSGVTPEDGTNVYHLVGVERNVGKKKQASNVLQFVEIYLDDTGRIDTRGIPPLKPGQTYTWTYDFKRSADAGEGSSRLMFRIDMRQPSEPSRQDCNPADGIFSLRV